MFGQLKSEAIFTFDIVTESPLYIRNGEDNSLDPSAVDGSYISIFRNGKYEPYIPGTSLKGSFRCVAERMLRDNGACDIINRKECISKRDVRNMQIEEKYSKSCPVCRVFGSQVLKSRVTFSDAYVDGSYKVGKRTCVAIDRITGAAKKNALYDMEYIEQGKFCENIKLQNFESYQLKLLVCLIDEMNEGFLTLGGLSSKGFGCVKAENIKLTIKHYSNDSKLKSLGYEKEEDSFYYIKRIEGLSNIKNMLKDIRFDNLKRGADIDEQTI